MQHAHHFTIPPANTFIISLFHDTHSSGCDTASHCVCLLASLFNVYLAALGLSCRMQDLFSCGMQTFSCGMWDLVP